MRAVHWTEDLQREGGAPLTEEAKSTLWRDADLAEVNASDLGVPPSLLLPRERQAWLLFKTLLPWLIAVFAIGWLLLVAIPGALTRGADTGR
jgi:hypothetical protein